MFQVKWMSNEDLSEGKIFNKNFDTIEEATQAWKVYNNKSQYSDDTVIVRNSNGKMVKVLKA